MMKKIIFLSLLLVVQLVTAQTTINKELKDFSVLKLYSGIDLELVKSDKQYVVITGEKADKIKIKEKDGVLKILLRFPETIADGTVKATLYFNKNIDVIDANEGTVITGKNLNQEKIEIKAQEGAFVNLVLKSKFLKVRSSSGAVIKLSGSTKNQTVSVDLGATYHGYNLAVSGVSNIKASSGAKTEINTGESLKARVSFGGTIFYKGKPKDLDKKKVIGGSIEERN